MKSEREVAQSCPTLSDPMDYSLPGSSIHGIFQARVLEWGAIAFSIAYYYLTIIIFSQKSLSYDLGNYFMNVQRKRNVPQEKEVLSLVFLRSVTIVRSRQKIFRKGLLPFLKATFIIWCYIFFYSGKLICFLPGIWHSKLGYENYTYLNANILIVVLRTFRMYNLNSS